MLLRGKSILKRAVRLVVLCGLTLLYILACEGPAAAQGRADSVSRMPSVPPRDSLQLQDSSRHSADTTSRASLEDSLGIRISPDALPSVVTASATDSAVLDMDSNLFFLYGDATVLYEDLTLKADKVMYNQADNTIAATPLSDTSTASRPSFQQGGETFTYDYLKYNFKSKRAIVRNARTQYGEGFVHSEQVKRNPDNSIYGFRSLYTTCDLDTPHYGISARRIKVVPGHIIVAGAANLTIEEVPTPIFLPFGVFPISETRRSGFRIPSYTIEEQRGLGLTNGGYYFHFSEYIDALVLATFFSKGSYSVGLRSTYANRYRYNGALSFDYAYNKVGEAYEPGASINKQFAINWRHQTDPKARPGQSFNSSVNIIKGNYYQDNSYNPSQILQNQFQSNVTYSRIWNGRLPASFTAALLHNQNTQSHIVNVTLPNVAFNISGFTPFARRNPVGSTRWYEKITASYSFTGLAQTTFYDTGFKLATLSLDDFGIGFRHSIPVSASYTIARYINFSAGINYNEYWLTDRFYQFYNSSEEKLDTIVRKGFFTARDFSATAQFSTRIYGIKRWRQGWLAGIRHVLTPNVGINYVPDYAAQPFGYYYQAYLTPGGQMGYYSPYQRSVVGVPGLGQYGRFASKLNFGLNNNLQIKTRQSSDTGATTKNITLIDGLSLNSGYNLAADSFAWDGFSLQFRTNILDKVSINAGALFDPYVYDPTLGRRVSRLQWNEGGGPNFQNAHLSLSSSFRSGDKSNTSSGEGAGLAMQPRGYFDYVDFNIPWSLNVEYTLSLDKVYRPIIYGSDTLQFNHSARVSGDVNLSRHIKLSVSSGYDFTAKQLWLTSIDIYRDLHCWEMHLGAIPFGPRKSYNFTLNVKASVLQDLKLVRRRDYRDAAF
jgi:lipopolysaccharide assembly outer membrane protein LptD (OstA)